MRMGDFNYSDTIWKPNCSQRSNKFLPEVCDNFICQKVEEITMVSAILYLILTNREECVEEVNLGKKLSCYT